MRVPRKRAGLQYLVEGLKRFGMKGAYAENTPSHDELDAVFSGLVGLFFWTGMFEALGNEDEDYLIIPDLKADCTRWLSRKIYGFSGHIASGKTTASRYLENKKGASYARYSLILAKLLKKEKIPLNRTNLQKIGLEIFNTPGKQRWLGKQIIKEVVDADIAVVDGVRFLEDKACLTEAFGPGYIQCFIPTFTLFGHKKGNSPLLLKGLLPF